MSAVEPLVIDAAKSVTIFEDDASPGAVMTGQTRSLFQTDSLAIRMKDAVS